MGPRHWLTAVALACCAGAAATSASEKASGTQKSSETYEELYARYLQAARATPQGVAPTTTSATWMADLLIDARARHVNDLVTVRVVENIEAVGTADSQLGKQNSASLSVPNFFGLENQLPDSVDPANLVNAASNTKFKGGGTTTRSGSLTATMTVRVVEVLPSGDLVLEGAREIDINGDRQIVVLSGVVRQVDLDRHNIVPSTRIGQLQIRYFGRGLMKDNLRPGWLVQLLNKIF